MKGKILIILSSAVALWLYPSHNAFAATFGERMARAGLNTILGMGTVFVVLIFISFIISLFKYILKFQNNLENKEKETSKNESPDHTDEKSITSQEPTEDDLYSEELVAVIAAAVAAAEGGSAEDFVVYSIKKRNNWCRS